MSSAQDFGYCAAAGNIRDFLMVQMDADIPMPKISAARGTEMKKSFSIVMLVIAGCVLGACGKTVTEPENEKMITVIHAEYPSYDTAQELVDEADLVFSGTIESVSYEVLDVRAEGEKDSVTDLDQSYNIPYTIYKVRVDGVYKGSSEEIYIHIKCPGGEVDDNQYIVEGAVILQEGERYLLLTKTFENTYPSLLNAAQSAYRMNESNVLNGENSGITLSDILDVLQ